MNPTSDKERANRAQHMDNALASVRMEGLEPSAAAKLIFERHVAGELTESEMGAALDDLHDRTHGPIRLSRDERSRKPA